MSAKLSQEDWEDIADLFDDAAATVDLKDTKPSIDGLCTKAAKEYAINRLRNLAIWAQGKATPQRKPQTRRTG
jgi:hypothetical protein